MSATFRGVVLASAFLLDPVLIGVQEARRRVLTLGGDGPYALPDGRWLVRLADMAPVRDELAPGQPLLADRGGLTVPGVPGERDMLTLVHGGGAQRLKLAELPRVPTRDWVDLTGMAVHRLSPLDEPVPASQSPAEPPRPDPDLRAAAGLKRTRARRVRLPWRTVLPRPGLGPTWFLAAVAVMGLAALLIVLALTRSGDRAHRDGAPARTTAPTASEATLPGGLTLPPGVTLPPDETGQDDGTSNGPHLSPVAWVVPVIALIVLLRRGRVVGRGAGSRTVRPRGPSKLRRVLSTMLARRDADVISRRHERYLARLAARARNRRWEDLLREAVALGHGTATPTWLTRRLPDARDTLRLQTRPGSGPAVRLAGSALGYLRSMYVDAARAMELSGDIDKAVFVHAELLRDVPAAVTLLEQQGRLRLAAELAEGRGLDAGLVVRLWWRAGERDEAIRTARAGNAFADAIARLSAMDPAAARDLRRAWMASCRDANDPLGAVDAAWPDPDLRKEVRTDLATAAALGGAQAGHALARLLAEFPSPAVGDGALALLDRDDPSLRRVRDGFVAGLVAERGSDAALDRRVCSAAVRSLLSCAPAGDTRRRIDALARRMDPLLRADLPAVAAPAPERDGEADLFGPDAPGRLAVSDAVALPGGAVLVAHGAAGVRLYTPDGHIRARWDVAAHRLVLADNGACALLVRRAGQLNEVHRLDLLTRRVRPWATLRAQFAVTSFDGTCVTVVDEDGIAYLDTLSERPRVLWRELDNRSRIHALNRTPDRLTGIVSLPGANGPTTQLWAWDLPSRTLRARRQLTLDGQVLGVLAGDGTAVLLAHDVGDISVTYARLYDREVQTSAPADATLHTDADLVATQQVVGGEVLCTLQDAGRTMPVHARFPSSPGALMARMHDGIATVFDSTGRILAAELADARLLACFATQP